MEGSGSVSLTNGSGKPQNLWIRIIKLSTNPQLLIKNNLNSKPPRNKQEVPTYFQSLDLKYRVRYVRIVLFTDCLCFSRSTGKMQKHDPSLQHTDRRTIKSDIEGAPSNRTILDLSKDALSNQICCIKSVLSMTF
jgi:hypothetical protein